MPARHTSVPEAKSKPNYTPPPTKTKPKSDDSCKTSGGKTMKYIIDIDAFKACLKLLQNPFIENGKECVYLHEVEAMLDSFPKDEYPIKNQSVLRDTSDAEERLYKYIRDNCRE